MRKPEALRDSGYCPTCDRHQPRYVTGGAGSVPAGAICCAVCSRVLEPAPAASRQLKMAIDYEPDNPLEQLLAAARRIETGLGELRDFVVAVDERFRGVPDGRG